MPRLPDSVLRHSYLEDIIPVIDYKPSGLRFSGKSNEDQIASLRTHFEALGLDSESIKALEILKKAGRIDYNVIILLVLTYSFCPVNQFIACSRNCFPYHAKPRAGCNSHLHARSTGDSTMYRCSQDCFYRS